MLGLFDNSVPGVTAVCVFVFFEPSFPSHRHRHIHYCRCVFFAREMRDTSPVTSYRYEIPGSDSIVKISEAAA